MLNLGTSVFEMNPRETFTAAVSMACPMKLDDVVKHHIESALNATKSRIQGDKGAAAVLVNPNTLRKRMKNLMAGIRLME